MCNHRWRQVREEFLLGGTFPIGWECLNCGKFVEQHKVTPGGEGGVVTSGARLIGPHGAGGQCSDGSFYKEQIVHEDGTLEIRRE